MAGYILGLHLGLYSSNDMYANSYITGFSTQHDEFLVTMAI